MQMRFSLLLAINTFFCPPLKLAMSLSNCAQKIQLSQDSFEQAFLDIVFSCKA